MTKGTLTPKETQFKVGDTIVGGPNASQKYSITSTGIICDVIRITSNNFIEVKVVGTPPDRKQFLNTVYEVEKRFFLKYNPLLINKKL